MRTVLVIVSGRIAAALLVFLGSAFFLAQRVDYGWDPGVSTPRFTSEHPRVLMDAAHHNCSIGIAGRYWPFARLLRAIPSRRHGEWEYTSASERFHRIGTERLSAACTGGAAVEEEPA